MPRCLTQCQPAAKFSQCDLWRPSPGSERTRCFGLRDFRWLIRLVAYEACWADVMAFLFCSFQGFFCFPWSLGCISLSGRPEFQELVRVSALFWKVLGLGMIRGVQEERAASTRSLLSRRYHVQPRG